MWQTANDVYFNVLLKDLFLNTILRFAIVKSSEDVYTLKSIIEFLPLLYFILYSAFALFLMRLGRTNDKFNLRVG